MSESGGQPDHENSVTGGAGDVVQARDVAGGVHFHYGQAPAGMVPPQQLPRGIRIFVSRAPDLERLDQLLPATSPSPDAAVVYVIAGTAGVGKTSLALHWAHRVRDRFPDGQLYIDLRGYDPGTPVTADEALERFLLALGIPAMAIPAALGEKSAMYRSVLSRKHMLIIIDNVGSVGQVRPLLPGATRSLTIATSRSRLTGLVVRDGAQRATVETLSARESVELLRATTADYRRADDPADLAELARLCSFLPLALRIAAERAATRPHMPLRQLIAELRDESGLWTALSTGEGSEADAVHTVFAWSYRALPEGAARLFCLLGLHPGNDFSEAAAAALTGDTGTLRASLDMLVGTCLLESKGVSRYQFHDLLRAYAIDQCRGASPADQIAATRRICEWYLHSARDCAVQLAHDMTLVTPLEPPSGIIPKSFADRTDAFRWYAEEKANLADAVTAASDAGLLLTACQLSLILERLYATFNHFQDWRRTSPAGLDAVRLLGLPEAEAALNESLGRLSRLTMQLDDAARYYERTLAIYRERQDVLSVVKTLNGAAWVYLFAHRLDAAHSSLEEGLRLVRGLGDRYWTATVLFSLGYTCLQFRRLADASDCLAQSLSLFRQLDDRLYESMALTAMSYLARLRNDADLALTSAQAATEISREMGNQLWEATALVYLGKAQRAAGQPGAALASFQHAAVICRQEGDASREAMAITGAGLAYADLGRPADAAQFYRRAVAISRQLSDRWKIARNLGHLADALSTRGGEPSDEANSYRQEAAAILSGFPDPKSGRLRSELATALGQA